MPLSLQVKGGSECEVDSIQPGLRQRAWEHGLWLSHPGFALGLLLNSFSYRFLISKMEILIVLTSQCCSEPSIGK